MKNEENFNTAWARDYPSLSVDGRESNTQEGGHHNDSQYLKLLDGRRLKRRQQQQPFQ